MTTHCTPLAGGIVEKFAVYLPADFVADMTTAGFELVLACHAPRNPHAFRTASHGREGHGADAHEPQDLVQQSSLVPLAQRMGASGRARGQGAAGRGGGGGRKRGKRGRSGCGACARLCVQVSGVHVEAIVGQAPGGHPLDAGGEVDWLASLGIPFPWRAVAYAHLARPDTEDALKALVRALTAPAMWLSCVCAACVLHVCRVCAACGQRVRCVCVVACVSRVCRVCVACASRVRRVCVACVSRVCVLHLCHLCAGWAFIALACRCA